VAAFLRCVLALLTAASATIATIGSATYQYWMVRPSSSITASAVPHPLKRPSFFSTATWIGFC
jgi:predicted secreted Zn-dependent protease